MLSQLDFSHERDLTIDELIRRVEAYYPDADFSMLKKAYVFAEEKHRDQKRSSGEPYIIHPLNVAATLVKLHLDLDSIVAGLLHDVVEDCNVQEETIFKEFSPTVGQIVSGLTKISKIEFKSKEENQAENFRKMVVAFAKDIRVIIVKLADRMHNMRTLQYVSEVKQKKIAQETLDIYVPLASRLGINSVKGELEDLCLRFLKPEVYYMLAEKVAKKKSEREKYINDVALLIIEKLTEYGVEAEVKGRPKRFYSIYKKMNARNIDFEQVQDVLAFRVIVSNITECYKCLGIVHSSFTPIPGRFKDYIAIPKANNYQSLHTTVIGPGGERIEIQIRTNDMDEVAETGVAAHWKYKEGMSNNKKLDWVQDLLDINKTLGNSNEFLDAVKNDLDTGGIFIFTPKGDVKELKYGSTPLDFAFAVHTEVGVKCVGAKVNSKLVSLKHRLRSGDTVEILTSKTQTPNKDWLKFVKTTRAKTKIKQWLLKIERDKQKDSGLDKFEKALKVFSSSVKNIKKNNELDKVLNDFNLKSDDELFVAIGSNKISIEDIIKKIPSLTSIQDKENKEKIKEIETLYDQISNDAKRTSKNDNAVIVEGAEDVLVRIAKCCNPIPGDNIVGFITRGRGITVHRHDCLKNQESDFERKVDVKWNSQYTFKHPVNIRVTAQDRPGILARISKAINNLDINIRSAIARTLPDNKGSFIFEVEVKDFSELLRTINAVESLEEVISVSRG